MNASGRINYMHLFYSLAVTAVGIGMLINYFGDLDLDKSREFAVLILIGILVEWLAVKFPLGRLSGSFSLVLASLLMYNPGASAWIGSVAYFIGNGVSDRTNSVRTSVFNMTQQVVTLFVSVYLFRILWRREPGEILNSGVLSILQLASLIILFFVINHILVYIYTYPGRKGARMHSWRGTLKWDALSYFFSAPFGIVMAVLYQKTGIAAALLLFLPILTVQFILSLYVRSELVNKELRAVYEINRRLGSGEEFREIPGVVLREMRKAIPFHTGVIYLWSEDTRRFGACAAYGPYRRHLEKGFVNPGEGFWGWVVNNGEPEIVFDSKTDPRIKDEQGLSQVLRSLLVIPLVGEAGPLGLVVIGEKKAMAFSDQDLQASVSICGSVSAALSSRVLAERLERYGTRDPLTGLLNRNSFYRSGLQAFERESSAGEGSLALILIDLDILGHINEGWGHETGDKMLSEMAYILKSLDIPELKAGRYGDDELALVLPGFDEQKAERLAAQLKEGLSDYVFSKQYPLLRIKASFGISDWPVNGEDFGDLLKKAGEALRQAKKNGRDCICTASELKGRFSAKGSWIN